jgi:hypothetical protein
MHNHALQHPEAKVEAERTTLPASALDSDVCSEAARIDLRDCVGVRAAVLFCRLSLDEYAAPSIRTVEA